MQIDVKKISDQRKEIVYTNVINSLLYKETTTTFVEDK